MINFITHNGNKYPSWQAIGGAIQWIMPLAKHIITGDMMVADIGFSKEEWRFPNAYGVDPSVIPEHGDAMDFKGSGWDAIISSHMLEHIKGNWADCLDYWLSKLRTDGVLFLYLPHRSQSYWHPTSNRKHVHSFDGSEIKTYLESLGYEPYLTPVDYNNSFAVICYKTKVDKFKDLKEQWVEAIKSTGHIKTDYNGLTEMSDLYTAVKNARDKTDLEHGLCNNISNNVQERKTSELLENLTTSAKKLHEVCNKVRLALIDDYTDTDEFKQAKARWEFQRDNKV